jgi:hypothetical protein
MSTSQTKEERVDKTTRRFSESVGMLMIGDGILGLVSPRQHCLLWHGGPRWWRDTVDWFAAHPAITRTCGATEVAAGLWLASSQVSNRLPPIQQVS